MFTIDENSKKLSVCSEYFCILCLDIKMNSTENNDFVEEAIYNVIDKEKILYVRYINKNVSI